MNSQVLGYFQILAIGLMLSLCSNETSAQSLKFGSGLDLTSSDSDFQINTGFRMQNLFVAEGPNDGSSAFETGFGIRRARIKFKGSALSSRFGFVFQMGISDRDRKLPALGDRVNSFDGSVLDAVVKWKFNKYLTMWAGQTKLPGNRERLMSSKKLLLVDRSLVNSMFNLDREMGIQLHGNFQAGQMVIRPMASVSMGEGRNYYMNSVGGYHYVGRLELLPFGQFHSDGDFEGVDLIREPLPKLAIGMSYSINLGSSMQKQSGNFLKNATGILLENDIRTILLDFIFKYRGLTAMFEFADKNCLGWYPERADEFQTKSMLDANGDSYFTGHGYNIQLGQMIPANWSLAVRLTEVKPNWEKSFTGANEYTLGIGKYIIGHNLKVQMDFSLVDWKSDEPNGLMYRIQTDISF